MYSTTGLSLEFILSQLGIPASTSSIGGVAQFRPCRKIKGSSSRSLGLSGPQILISVVSGLSHPQAVAYCMYVHFSHLRIYLSQWMLTKF
jgi:hypothetical protein